MHQILHALVGIPVRRFTSLSVFKSPYWSPLFFPDFFSFSFIIVNSLSAFWSCSCNSWMSKSVWTTIICQYLCFWCTAAVSGVCTGFWCCCSIFRHTCVRVIGYFLFNQYARNFFVPYLWFSGLLFRDNFRSTQWVLSLSFQSYPKSSVGSGLSFVGWPSLKSMLHTLNICLESRLFLPLFPCWSSPSIVFFLRYPFSQLERETVWMVAHSCMSVSRSNIHEQCRFVWPIYSAFSRCWDIEQLHNSGAQIPYLERKSKQNDFRRETCQSPANIPL